MGKIMGFKACFLCGIELDAEFDPEKFQCRNLKKKALSCSSKDEKRISVCLNNLMG